MFWMALLRSTGPRRKVRFALARTHPLIAVTCAVAPAQLALRSGPSCAGRCGMAADVVLGYVTARLDQIEAQLLHECQGHPRLVEALAELNEVRSLMRRGGEATDDA